MHNTAWFRHVHESQQIIKVPLPWTSPGCSENFSFGNVSDKRTINIDCLSHLYRPPTKLEGNVFTRVFHSVQVATELRTAGKRAVRILLECFLVWVNISCAWLGVDIWIQWYFSFNCHFSVSARCGCGFRAGFIRKYRQNELPEGGWLCARSHPWTEHQFRQQGWRGCLFELPFYTDESQPVQ